MGDATFRATFATLGVRDKDGDVILPGAFEEGQRVKIAGFGHNWSAVVGKGAIHADSRRAWVDGQFNLATQAGREHYETVKFHGPDMEWSFGFQPLDHSFGDFEGQRVSGCAS